MIVKYGEPVIFSSTMKSCSNQFFASDRELCSHSEWCETDWLENKHESPLFWFVLWICLTFNTSLKKKRIHRICQRAIPEKSVTVQWYGSAYWEIVRFSRGPSISLLSAHFESFGSTFHLHTQTQIFTTHPSRKTYAFGGVLILINIQK